VKVLKWLLILALTTSCWATSSYGDRQEAEYYVAAYVLYY